MERHIVDKISVRVPADEGFIIGDFLRKYAVRSIGSWQTAAYLMELNSVNFGSSDGSMLSYLESLKGRLVCRHDIAPADPIIVELAWNGTCFANDDFELHDVSHGMGEVVKVCLIYGKGHHSSRDNYEIVRQVVGPDKKFLAVPTSHSKVSEFRYDVESNDDKTEWLVIEADRELVRMALENAVRSLEGLNI